MNKLEIFVIFVSEEVSGTGQSDILRPRRILVPQREGSRSSASNVGPMLDTKKSRDVVSLSQGHMAKDSIAGTKSTATVMGETQEDASITPPSILGTTTKTFDESLHQFDARRDQPKPITGCQDNDPMASLSGESQDPGGQKKVLSSTRSNASQGICLSLLFLDCLESSFCFNAFMEAFRVTL